MKDAVTDICERMHELRMRYQVVFREMEPTSPPYIPMAEALVAGLRDEAPSAVNIAKMLVGSQALTDRQSFWSSPFGRLLFAAGGYWNDSVSQSFAAAVLGCTRQWAHELVSKGELRPAPGGCMVLVESVREVLKGRIHRLDRDVK